MATELALEIAKRAAMLCVNAVRLRAKNGVRIGIVWPTCPQCQQQMSRPADITSMKATGLCCACVSSQDPT